jgi:hypothetical protein
MRGLGEEMGEEVWTRIHPTAVSLSPGSCLTAPPLRRRTTWELYRRRVDACPTLSPFRQYGGLSWASDGAAAERESAPVPKKALLHR